MAERWRVVFFSMALPAVRGMTAFVQACGHEPVALITPRPRGDNRERFGRLVAEVPEELDVVVVPSKERLAEYTRLLAPDLVICAGFSWLIPQEVIDIPRLGIVNSHPSLLPKYRGPVPFSWAFRNGDTELGLTYHLMDASFDTGPVLAQGSVPISEDDWLEDLLPKLAELATSLLPKVFERLAAGDRGDPQSEDGASYAPFLEEEYREVDWSRGAREIHNQTRAWNASFGLSGAGPVAELDGRRVHVVRTSLRPVDGAREVATGDGSLWLVETAEVD